MLVVRDVVLTINSSFKRNERFKDLQNEPIQIGVLKDLQEPLELIEDDSVGARASRKTQFCNDKVPWRIERSFISRKNELDSS